jgi:hypothetical protein
MTNTESKIIHTREGTSIIPKDEESVDGTNSSISSVVNVTLLERHVRKIQRF